MTESFGADWEKELLRCNKCGFCQDACPTYKVTGRETALARGRVRLMRLGAEGKYDLLSEREIAEILDTCLLCKACVTVCPASVATDQLVLTARSRWRSAHGLTAVQKYLYRGIFSHNRRLRTATKLIRFYQKNGIRWAVKSTGLLEALGAAGKAEGMLPEIPAQTVRDYLAQASPLPQPARRVAYFVGCAVDNFFSPVGIATVEVLRANNRQVLAPDTRCCGAPHMSGGDLEEARRLARHNIDRILALQADRLVTDCATCGSMLREYAHLLADDAAYREKARQVAGMVTDVCAYLVETGFDRNLEPVEATVTIHDPCHLARGLKSKDFPREVLRAIPGIKIIEMQEPDMCCGGAGSYSITHPDFSGKILDRKINNFKATGAGVMVTSCPACTMQLSYGLKQHGLGNPVLHPVQLLARSYQAKTSGQPAE